MSLNKICSISNMSISEKLESNLITLFDWGFTDKGGYINVDVNQSGNYVNNLSSLIKVTGVTGAVVWQGPENWVYESGVSVGNPNSPPSIYVNNILNTGCAINYRDGYVVAPATGVTSVKAEFSYKWVTFTSSRKSNSIRRLQARQTRFDIDNMDVKLPTEIRIPLPCVTIDCPPISRSRPYGIGGPIAQFIYEHEVDFHIIGESASDVTRIADYICAQKGQEYRTFDPALVRSSGDFPLNFNGTKNSGKNYDQLCALYPWSTIFIKDAEGLYGSYLDDNLYQANVRMITEVIACLGC